MRTVILALGILFLTRLPSGFGLLRSGNPPPPPESDSSVPADQNGVIALVEAAGQSKDGSPLGITVDSATGVDDQGPIGGIQFRGAGNSDFAVNSLTVAQNVNGGEAGAGQQIAGTINGTFAGQDIVFTDLDGTVGSATTFGGTGVKSLNNKQATFARGNDPSPPPSPPPPPPPPPPPSPSPSPSPPPPPSPSSLDCSSVPNCRTCIPNTAPGNGIICTSCNVGFGLESGGLSCTSCSVVPNCIACIGTDFGNSAVTCTVCPANSALDINTTPNPDTQACTVCSTVINGCATCIDGDATNTGTLTCQSCLPNFSFSNGACTPIGLVTNTANSH